MNNKILIGVILVIVIVGGLFYFLRKGYQPSQTPSATQTQQLAAAQPQTEVAADTVTIQNFAFNPDTLTVSVGTKVTWINQDAVTHKIKSDTFNSADLSQGDKFEFTFNTKGTFDYSCSIHPSMTGKIVVE